MTLCLWRDGSRVLRHCIEMAEHNPIISIHDQGAGGNGNVLKEIVEPLGAHYDLRKVSSSHSEAQEGSSEGR